MHPAHGMDFVELYAGLMSGVIEGTINRTEGPDGLELFCYSESCVYERKWNKFSLMARGLIVHVDSLRVVATPFPKFFNVGEREDESLPDLPFETFEKMDGSLIILFHFNGEWRTATKGSFDSEQAKWAQDWIAYFDLLALDTNATYLCEAIYPENRIVVSYHFEGLTLLAAYRNGAELSRGDLTATALALGWRLVERHYYLTVSSLLAEAQTLPADREGFVLRFANGLRVKIKGEEYKRIHRLVSRVTPLAVWEAMQAGDDLEEMRKQLPEEFWADFDTIRRILTNQVNSLSVCVEVFAKKVEHLPDREVGMMLDTFPEFVRRFIFPYRKNGGDLFNKRSRSMLFRDIRPTGNRLEGYRPSSAVNRLKEAA